MVRSITWQRGALALGLFVTVAVAAAPPGSAGAASEPYLIGATVSESGPGSSLGRPEADSMQMAVDEINRAGGVNGHPLQITILDDESNPSTAVNNVRKLLDAHPIALLGSSLTQTSLVMVPLATQAQIPMISFASSAQVIQPVSDRKWIFKMPITDFHTAQTMQEFMKKKGWTKVGVIYRNDDYGKTGLGHFQDAGKKAGFEVVDVEAIAANASDATTQLTHLKAANPQAIVAWTSLPSAAVILKGYRELGMQTPLLYSDGAATGVFVAQAGPALDGVYIASTKINVADTVPKDDPQRKILDHYIASFTQLYPKDGPVSIFGGFGYDGVYALAHAMKDARSANGGPLRDALEHLTYTGVSGTYRMSGGDHNGLSTFSIVVTQVEHGKFTVVK